MTRLGIVLFGAVLCLPTGSSGQVYKWRDKRGQFHASDDWRDVPDHIRAQILKTKPSAAPRLPDSSRRTTSTRATVRDAPRDERGGAREVRGGPVARPSGRATPNVVVLSIDGIRVPPEKRDDRAFWEGLVGAWKKQLDDAREARDIARKEARLRAQIRQFIPLRIHTDAMLEAEAKAAKLEARMADVQRVLDETIPRLAREAGANPNWLK